MPRQNRGETKWEAYARLITRRLPNALDEIRKVRRLFEGTDYEYTDPEAQRVFTALFEAIKPISPVKIHTTLASSPMLRPEGEEDDAEEDTRLIGENKIAPTDIPSETGRLAERAAPNTGQPVDKNLPEPFTEWPEKDFRGLTPVSKSELAWAFDMLNRGEVYEAKIMLRRVLYNLKDFKHGNQPGTTERRFTRKG